VGCAPVTLPVGAAVPPAAHWPVTVSAVTFIPKAVTARPMQAAGATNPVVGDVTHEGSAYSLTVALVQVVPAGGPHVQEVSAHPRVSLAD